MQAEKHALSARTVTLTWAVLVALTVLAWLFARGTAASLAAGILVALAGAKIYLIAAVFMGVWRAPVAWHVAMIVWLGALITIIGYLVWRSLA